LRLAHGVQVKFSMVLKILQSIRIDDIIIWGNSKSDHDKTLNKVLNISNSSLFDEFHSRFKMAHACQKKAQFTHERVEYNVFLFDEPLKGSKSLIAIKTTRVL
jgi:hypothetical protein